MTQRFKHFCLQALTGNRVLVLNGEQCILSAVAEGEIVEQQMLAPSEMYVIEELLKTYPEYCPNEVLLSAMTGQSIERCQEKVLWGQEERAVDAVMRPFGIEIKSLANMGYVLIPIKGRVRAQAVAVS